MNEAHPCHCPSTSAVEKWKKKRSRVLQVLLREAELETQWRWWGTGWRERPVLALEAMWCLCSLALRLCVDVCGLCYHYRPHGCPRAMLQRGTYFSERPALSPEAIVMSEPVIGPERAGATSSTLYALQSHRGAGLGKLVLPLAWGGLLVETWADQLSCHPCLHPGIWAVPPHHPLPQHLHHQWPAGACEGTSPGQL